MTAKEFLMKWNPTLAPVAEFKQDLQSVIETAIAGFLESPEYKAIQETGKHPCKYYPCGFGEHEKCYVDCEQYKPIESVKKKASKQ